MNAYGGEEVEFNVSITSTVSRPDHLSPRENKAQCPRAGLDALLER
jgi:hypothetical protein